jgi:TonB family protein
MNRIAYLLVVLALGLLNAVAQTTPAANPRAIQDALNSQFKDQIVTLRVFYPASDLHFTSEGRYKGKDKQGSWTLWSKIKVSAIEITAPTLVIKGQRVYVVYDGKEGRFANVLSKEKVVIVFEFEGAPITSESANSAFESIALRNDEHLSDLLPLEWQHFVKLKESMTLASLLATPQAVNQSKIGGTITAPRVLSAPDPEYPEQARKAGLQGIVILWTVVDTDGRISEVHISRPLGMGLDEKAIEAVRRWRFEPARQNGKPVKSQINIEVNFRLW